MTVYRFNTCVVDPTRRELTLDGRLVDVQPLIFDLLLFLLEHANRVVSKEDMLKAAWRSTVVSDSVVARAIMKLRRAIGDDAGDARTVQTVHRIGYRLMAEVHRVAAEVALPQAALPPAAPGAEAAPMVGLAITAFENLSGDATLEAVLPELGHVVRHLVGGQRVLASVSPSDALVAWQAAAGEADPLASACERLRVTELAVLSVMGSAGQYAMRLIRGHGADHQSTQRFTGPDLLGLAQRMADCLCMRDDHADPALDTEREFWQAEYLRAVRLQQSGQVDAALELVGLCSEHLPATVPMQLMQGRLHLALSRFDDARAAFDAAEHQARADGAPAMEFQVLLARSELALAQGDPAETGLQHGLQALALLRAHPALAGEAPGLIMRFADMVSADSRGTEAIQLAERAMATAQRLGLRSVELSCRLGLGRTLLRFRQLHRAAEVLHRVIELAQSPDDRIKLDALLLLAEVERFQHRYLSSVDIARQARALARRVNPVHVGHAMTLEMEGLLDAGQTDTVAKSLLLRWGFEDGLDPTAPPAVVKAHAVVLWRQGQRERAVDVLKALVEALPDDTPPALRAAVAAELCFMGAAAGLAQETQAWRDQVEPADVWLRTRVEAAAALSTGRRDDARECLSQVWFSDGSNPWDGFDTGVDLAWMLTEDDAHDELERVIGQVFEMPSDHGPVQLVQVAYTLPDQGDALRLLPWRQAVARYPGLLQRHPALTQGPRAQRLPELLTRACY